MLSPCASRGALLSQAKLVNIPCEFCMPCPVWDQGLARHHHEVRRLGIRLLTVCKLLMGPGEACLFPSAHTVHGPAHIVRKSQPVAPPLLCCSNSITGVMLQVKILSRHTGHTQPEVEKDIVRTRYFDPYEAVDYGIIDRVRAPCVHEWQAMSGADAQLCSFKACLLSGPGQTIMQA